MLCPTAYLVSEVHDDYKEEAYLHLPNQPPIIHNNRYPIDDNLHQQLNLEDPKEQNREEHRDTGASSVVTFLSNKQQGTHPGFNVPSRKSHAIIAMIRLATISPHTI